MGTTLVVIYLSLVGSRSGYFVASYPTHEACVAAKRQVKSRTTKTWRYCV